MYNFCKRNSQAYMCGDRYVCFLFLSGHGNVAQIFRSISHTFFPWNLIEYIQCKLLSDVNKLVLKLQWMFTECLLAKGTTLSSISSINELRPRHPSSVMLLLDPSTEYYEEIEFVICKTSCLCQSQYIKLSYQVAGIFLNNVLSSHLWIHKSQHHFITTD